MQVCYINCSLNCGTGFLKVLFITGVIMACGFGLRAQSQQKMGLDSFPINDNNSSSVVAAIDGGWEINGFGKVCKLVRYSSSVMFACTSSGGIYKTTDNGNTWHSISGSFLPGVQLGCLAIDPTNPNTLYAGTGEATYAQVYYWGGYGVVKSTDGGATWTTANSGMGNQVVLDLLINPTNNMQLVAACAEGIYVSVNGGATWSLKQGTTSYVQQLAQRGTSDTLFAITANSFMTSTNWGNTWTSKILDVANSSALLNGRLAIAPSNTQVVYASWIVNYQGNYTQAEVFQSTDAGATFTENYTLTSLPALSSYDGTVNGGGYGWANWCIAVDPSDANKVYTGAHLVNASTDGGITFASTVADWWCCLHTDIHNFNIEPANPNTIFAATDGGVFVSTDDGVDWQQSSNGLDCSQYYSFAQSHLDSTFVVGGTQDNAIMYLNDDNHLHTYDGGDYSGFMECDYFNAHNTYTYTTDVVNNVTLSGAIFDPYNRANCANLNLPADVISGTDENPVMEFSHLNPGRAFCYNTEIWITDNLNSYTMNAQGGISSITWTQLATPSAGIQALAVAPNNDNLVYFVTDDGKFNVLTISNSTQQSLTSVALPGPSSATASITVSALNPWVIYVVADNKVYRSTNGGSNFYDITKNLPGINFQSVYLDPYSTVEGAYLITDLGVYYNDLAKQSWVSLDSGFDANVQNTTATFYQVIAGSGIYAGGNSAASHIAMGTWGGGMQRANFYVQQCDALQPNYLLNNYGPQFSTASACYDAHDGTGAYTMVTNGGSIGAASDQYSMLQGEFTGNGTINTSLLSVEQGDTTQPGQTGLMMRANTTAANAPFVMIGATGDNQPFLKYRSVAGGSTTDSLFTLSTAVAYPAQLKLTRSGNTFTAFFGEYQVGQVTLALGDSIFAGVAAAAGSSQLVNHTAFTTLADTGFTQINTGIPSVTNVAEGLYPDPAQNNITMQLLATGSLTYRVFDVLGQLQLTGNIPANTAKFNLNINNLPTGNYFINLVDNNNASVGRLRFIKN